MKSEKIVKTLVKEFKRIRKDNNMNLTKVAQRAGLHRTAIGFIEKNKRIPTIYTCLCICEALGVELSDLVRKAQGNIKNKGQALELKSWSRL